ncbi:MAG TPA: zf-TFIIB domain-containing protein [Deltaproteobacteria bacterium]|mgnify:CR=1 FL=1|nr:zf-TFIIB domain-containing protein [Deltaproteobacteria bacterium]HPR56186.1 zf-TFIIB domain-containing protein [Deltaproteobacteria bacterium]HXK46439.1 zf-TFIIB domain-containing protein [Deltaproteobacteria bacterium]
MQCPGCSGHLVTLEISGVEVDYCFTCQGIWLDNGEMERLVGLEGGDDRVIGSLRPTSVGEKTKRCPACRRVMEKVATGSGNVVILDRCRNHGMWSDAGELKKILELSCHEGHESPLVGILDDMFAARKGRCV